MNKTSNNELLLAQKHLDQGKELSLQQKFAASEKHLQLASELFKKHEEWKGYAESSSTRIHNYLHLSQFEKAESESTVLLQIILQYLPADVSLLSDCHNNIGSCHLHRGKYKEAIHHFEEVLKLQQAHLEENHLDIARSWMFIGDCYMAKSELKKAMAYFQKALQIHSQHPEFKNLQLAENHEKIGACLTTLSKYKEAIEHHQKALKIKRELIGEDTLSMAKSYEQIGKTYQFLGNYAKSEAYLNQALDLQQKHLGKKHPAIANIYTILVEGYYSQSYFHKSLTLAQKACAIYTEFYTENHLTVSETQTLIGSCYMQKGNYDKAIAFFQKSLTYFQNNEDVSDEIKGTTYNEIGYIYRLKGDYEQAILYLKKGEELLLKSLGKEHSTVAIIFTNIALTYLDKGDIAKARTYIHQSMDIRRKIFGEHHHSVGNMYHVLARLAGEDKDYFNQRIFYEKSLRINSQVFGSESMAVVYNYRNLGVAHMNLKEYDKALEYLQQALKQHEKLASYNHPDTANIRSYIGDVYTRKRDYLHAVQYYHTSLQILTENVDDSDTKPLIEKYTHAIFLMRAITSKAAVLFQWYQQEGKNDLKKLHAVLAHYQANQELIKLVQQDYKGELSQLLLANKAKQKYDIAIQVALLLKELEPQKQIEYQNIAFNFAEQGKALVLLSKFKDVEASYSSNIPHELLQELKQIRIELNYLDKNLKKKKALQADSQKELQNQYFHYKQQYYALIEKFEKEYPEYFRLKYATETVSITELQKHLQSTTAIVEYSVAKHHIFSFFIDKQQIRTHQTPKPSNFDQTIFHYLIAINTGSATKFVKTATQLYDWLIAPFEAFLEEKQRLIFIPDENLHQLCFDTLVNQNAITKPAFIDLPYLIKGFEISHHYSATLLLHIAKKRQHTQKQKDSFLGLAPVSFNENKKRSKGYIVKSEANSQKKAKTVILKSSSKNEQVLMDLDASEVEVKKVFDLFQQQNLESLALFYQEASKSNLQKLVKGYKYVLISTHGFVNKSQPSLSGLYLSKSDFVKNEDGEKNTSKLYLSDAYQLSLTADLVVLSSCESGIGEVLKGEGMIALNRGFLYAGASNVIYSLFKVPQDSTSELVQALFRHILHQKCSYSQALRLAKLQLIEAGGELRDWAGFALLGS
ncbi:MAG: tetratricopeptide repeat protein [Chitinophagales bacterium]